MQAIKHHESSLVTFSSVIERAIMGRGYHKFSKLTAIDDFVDGF